MIDARIALRNSCLDPADEAALRSAFADAWMARGEHFIREGEPSIRFAVVESGLFRSYYLDDEGRDFTKHFFAEGSILFSYAAYSGKAPSAYSIEALEDSSLSVARVDELMGIAEGRPALRRLAKDLLDGAMIEKERRSTEFVLLDSEGRYRRFQEENPGLEARIKQHQLASYLGITAVSLSRLRRRLLVNKR
jgi:CRP-like cAMP-binding protein